MTNTNEVLSGWALILAVAGWISIAVVLALLSLSALSRFRFRKGNLERQLRDTIMECKETESRCIRGCAVFRPEPRHVYLFDILVSRGTLMRNPLGGYSFPGPARGVWGNDLLIENIARVSADEYEDPDEVIARGHNEKGELVPFMIEKMVDGKIVACDTEEFIKYKKRIEAERDNAKEKENGDS